MGRDCALMAQELAALLQGTHRQLAACSGKDWPQQVWTSLVVACYTSGPASGCFRLTLNVGTCNIITELLLP